MNMCTCVTLNPISPPEFPLPGKVIHCYCVCVVPLSTVLHLLPDQSSAHPAVPNRGVYIIAVSFVAAVVIVTLVSVFVFVLK